MTTPSNKPTHRAYAVTKRGEKSRWQEIGAAWAHKDSKGFNLKLDYLPLNGADVVLRIPTEKSVSGDMENCPPGDTRNCPLVERGDEGWTQPRALRESRQPQVR